jgi:hypothetical protein
MDTKKDSNTPRLVVSGHCEGRDVARLFAILLRDRGNVSVAEVRQ